MLNSHENFELLQFFIIEIMEKLQKWFSCWFSALAFHFPRSVHDNYFSLVKERKGNPKLRRLKWTPMITVNLICILQFFSHPRNDFLNVILYRCIDWSLLPIFDSRHAYFNHSIDCSLYLLHYLTFLLW